MPLKLLLAIFLLPTLAYAEAPPQQTNSRDAFLKLIDRPRVDPNVALRHL